MTRTDEKKFLLQTFLEVSIALLHQMKNDHGSVAVSKSRRYSAMVIRKTNNTHHQHTRRTTVHTPHRQNILALLIGFFANLFLKFIKIAEWARQQVKAK